MAKRHRGVNLHQYGYPKERALRRRARGLAAASLPTEASIRRQYQRQLKDVGGFGTALVSALQGQQSATNGAWSDALAQQQQLAAAARAELGGLGLQYAGAAVAGGASVDAGTARVLQDQAAASQYAGALPGVGAARTHLSQLGVESAQNDALTQRKDAFRQATMQAYQQLQQNAQAQATNLAQMDQQSRQFNAQLQQNNQQFQQNLDFQRQQAKVSAEQWNQEMTLRKQAALADILSKVGGGAGGRRGGTAPRITSDGKVHVGNQVYTQTQWRSLVGDSYDNAVAAVNHGDSPQGYIQKGLAHGVPRYVLVQAIKRTYGKLKGPNPDIHPQMYNAYQAYIKWLNRNGRGVPPPRRGGGRTIGGRK